MNEQLTWRHSETRAISPFLVSRSCLKRMKFRLAKNEEFSSIDPWTAIVEPDHMHSADFEPEFLLELDREALVREADVDPAQFRLSIVLRDAAIWSSKTIASWSLTELPPSYLVPRAEVAKLAGQRGLQLAMVVTPTANLGERFRRAWRKGQIVARRDFILVPPTDGVGFPIQVVPSTVFVSKGLPAEAVWYIDWMDWLDFDRAPEDVLCIHVNEDVATKLLQIAGNDALGNLLWANIAADALLEICLKIFSSDPKPPEDPNSLLARVIGMLQDVSSEDLDTLVAWARSPEGWRVFRAYVQVALDLGKKSKALNVGGRRR